MFSSQRGQRTIEIFSLVPKNTTTSCSVRHHSGSVDRGAPNDRFDSELPLTPKTERACLLLVQRSNLQTLNNLGSTVGNQGSRISARNRRRELSGDQICK
jgi:hypothetical protein